MTTTTTAAPTCGYLGCQQRATTAIVPQYGRHVYRCEQHSPATLKAYQEFDNRQGRGTESRPIRGGTR